MTASTRHFIRHYVEMLVAMFAGMVVLGGPAMLALGAAGVTSAELRGEAPAALLLGMGITMTVPMIAWMRYRGHGWTVCLEMAAAMIAPAVPLCILRVADVISGGLCGASCLLSLVAMIGVVVYRRDYYSHEARAA